jgi:hypothetical protein
MHGFRETILNKSTNTKYCFPYTFHALPLQFNPSATASADVGFGAEKKGSIKYVSMSDLQSGKVQIPKNSDDLEAISGSEIPPPFQ